MKKNILLYHILVLFLGAILISCATPIAPTGGPADKQGPEIEYTNPETGTTNFKGRKFEFYFNEFINRSSVPNEITIEPDLGLEYKIDWRKKRLTIEFGEKLPDSTTVIVKLGPDITDTRNNKMGSPYTVAVSTGDEIDEGNITGGIRSAKDGSGMDAKVLLYRVPVDYSSKAAYEAQTDTIGAFTFSYLREGRYQAIMVNDRNRNKTWEQSSEYAQPFAKEFVQLEKKGKDTLDVIYVPEVDTVRPRLLGIGLLSTQRLRLRFSEPVQTSTETKLNILDSTRANYSNAYPLYIPEEDNFVILIQSEKELKEENSYFFRMNGITDYFGNTPDTTVMSFTGSAQNDTTLQRIITTNQQDGITQGQPFEITYAAPIVEPQITDSVVVVEGNVSFDDWPEISTSGNKLIISPQQEWIEGVAYQFMAWNPSTQQRKLFEPEVWDSTDFGEIEINIQNDSTTVYHAEVLNSAGKVVHKSSFSNNLLVENLAPLSYTIRVFEDQNNNGEWEAGTVIPFSAPEPYYVQKAINVQQGFTSEINISFK